MHRKTSRFNGAQFSSKFSPEKYVLVAGRADCSSSEEEFYNETVCCLPTAVNHKNPTRIVCLENTYWNVDLLQIVSFVPGKQSIFSYVVIPFSHSKRNWKLYETEHIYFQVSEMGLRSGLLAVKFLEKWFISVFNYEIKIQCKLWRVISRFHKFFLIKIVVLWIFFVKVEL